jgi:hypothetical protein
MVSNAQHDTLQVISLQSMRLGEEFGRSLELSTAPRLRTLILQQCRLTGT